MTLKDYYHRQFRSDLATMFRGMDARDIRFAFGNDWVRECSLLPKVPEANRARLLVCLYFTVLADQTMHAHFYFLHQKFEELTRYPKFMVGFGHEAHMNPMRLFEDAIRHGLVQEKVLRCEIPDAMRLFVDEVKHFFERHMPELSSREFFERLLADAEVTGVSGAHSLPGLLANSLRDAYRITVGR